MITTWGFGGQGGLVSVMGWGGSTTLFQITIPCKPRIVDTLELVPQIIGSDCSDPEPSISTLELVPRITDTKGDC